MVVVMVTELTPDWSEFVVVIVAGMLLTDWTLAFVVGDVV